MKTKVYFLEILFVLLVTSVIFMLDITKLETGQILISITLLANIQQLIKFKKHDALSVFLFFSLLYWVYLMAYYFLGIQYHLYTEYQTPYLTNLVVYLQFLFQRFIFIGVSSKDYNSPNKLLKIKSNLFIFYSLIFVLTMMAIAGIYGKKTIIDQPYSINTDSSIWFEYCIPVLIVSYLYANSKFKRCLVLFFGVIFMIEPLLFGRRLPFIMVALTIFNLHFSGKYKLRYIFVFVIISFVLLRYFGDTRNPISGDVGLFTSLLSLSADGVMQNNQGGVVVCSATYLGLIEDGLFDIWFSIKSFIGLFTGVVIPSSLNIKEAYVNFEALKYASIPGNGGLSGVYLYIWGRVPLVIIGSLFLNYFVRNKSKSKINTIYLLFILSIFPRWYAYNMLILIKMGFWLILLVVLTDGLHKSMRHIK